MTDAGLHYFLVPKQGPTPSVSSIGGDVRVDLPMPAEPIQSGASRSPIVRVLTLALVVVSTIVATVILDKTDPVLWMTNVAIAAGMVLRVASVQRISLSTELRFVRRLALRVGAAVFAASVLGLLDLTATRQILVIVATAAVALLAIASLITWRSRARQVLLVGDRKAVGDLVHQWQGQRGLDIGAICLANEDETGTLEDVAGLTVHGGLASVRRVALARHIDQVVVAPGPFVSAYDVRRLSWALENTPVDLAVAAEVHGATPRRIAPELIGRRLVLSVGSSQPRPLSLMIKGAVDRLAGIVLLTFFAIPLAVLAGLVRLDSSGPSFFRQERAGRFGASFTMYKLRTMTADAEDRLDGLREHNEAAGPLFKLRHDPRVTKLGKVLRKTSLDELPQLINVVRGQMSLIGPRPGLPSETDAYDDWTRRRLQVKPGMTGLWQVSGRSNLGWNESVRLDLDYVDNLTLRDEFSIAYKTVRAVLQRDGAM